MKTQAYKYDYPKNNVLYPSFSIPEPKSYYYQSYGKMRESYLKRKNRSAYFRLLTSFRLESYLKSLEKKCEAMEEDIIAQLEEEYGVSQELWEENREIWIRQMNTIRARAREIVVKAMIEV